MENRGEGQVCIKKSTLDIPNYSVKEFMSVISSAQGTVSTTDNVTGSTTWSKTLNSIFTGDLSTVAQNLNIGTSSTTVAVPNSLAGFFYIKNLSATSTVTIVWTPLSGSPITALTLDPNAILIFCESGTNGIIALSLTASAASTPVEFFLAG